MGDFNLEPSTVFVKTLYYSHDLHNLVKEDTCFKERPRCYNLILTNFKYNFQNTIALTTWFSDFHKMTVIILKTESVKADPIQIKYRNNKNLNLYLLFQEGLRYRLYDDSLSIMIVSNFVTLERDGTVSIHQRNIQTLATKIFRTKND